MPELPDVETFRRYFEKVALGKRIENAEVRSPRILKNFPAEEFVKRTTGRTFSRTVRIGKNLLVELETESWLLFHFGMTGYLYFYNDPAKEPGHVRVLFTLPDGKLAYDNRRMIGQVGLVASPDDLVRQKGLGPDALAIDAASFRERVQARHGDIKSVLMDQSVVAGIGNIYADEILYQCRIHPKSAVSSISAENFDCLFDTARRVCLTAVECEVDAERMPDFFLLPHRSRHGRCQRCSSEFSTMKIGGRTTYFCPVCQSAQ